MKDICLNTSGLVNYMNKMKSQFCHKHFNYTIHSEADQKKRTSSRRPPAKARFLQSADACGGSLQAKVQC